MGYRKSAYTWGWLIPLFLFMLPVSVSAGNEKAKGPIPVILETDMGNDVDDALAVDLLFKAADDGSVKVLAIGNHKRSETATAYIDILCTFLGYPQTPVAKSATPVGKNHDKDYTSLVVNMKDKFGCPLYKQSKKSTDIREPVSLFREVLSMAEDSSVVFISLGFGTDLAALMESPADEYSDLTGMELIARKVKYLSIMAGSYGPDRIKEFNVVNDISAMKEVFEHWPTAIVQNPFELGTMIMFPAEAIFKDSGSIKPDPVADAYVNYKKMPYDRPSWDILSVVYVLHPEMFGAGSPGRVKVDSKGYTSFTKEPDGNSVRLFVDKIQANALLKYIVCKTSQIPENCPY